jgi:iron uptake system EfeUOB component EfeO/EfeM
MPLAQVSFATHRLSPAPFRRWLAPLPVAIAVLTASLAPAVAADTLAKGADAYKSYVAEQISGTLAGAKDLQKAVRAGDAKAAQAAWIKSRAGWERIEPVTAEFFAELDEAIDAWPDGKLGYHAIEARLFAGNLAELPAPTDKLVADLAAFQKAVQAAKFDPQGLLNGVTKLAFELGEKKAQGGESPYAGTSLIDMRDNLAGIEALYRTVLQSPLKAKDGKLAQSIEAKINDIETTLKAPDLKSLDQAKLRKTSEELAALLQDSAAKLNLKKPALGG